MIQAPAKGGTAAPFPARAIPRFAGDTAGQQRECKDTQGFARVLKTQSNKRQSPAHAEARAAGDRQPPPSQPIRSGTRAPTW